MAKSMQNAKFKQESHAEYREGDIQHDLDALKDDIEKLRSDFGHLAQGYIGKGRDKVRVIRDDIVQSGQKAKNSVEENISKHPLTTIAIAATVGLIVGGLSKFKRSRKEE